MSWLISASLGTRRPAATRSVRPVSSSTHSRITEGPGNPAPVAAFAILPAVVVAVPEIRSSPDAVGADGAVVMVSVFPLDNADDRGDGRRDPCESSGKARFVRRGGLVDPMSGRIYFDAKRWTKIGIRNVLSPRISAR